MADIIERHMGQAFYRLAPVLQRVHSGNIRLEGRVEVRHGGGLARLICKLFRFPPEGQNLPLRVDCRHSPDTMHWQRFFGGHEMVSHFHLSGRWIREKLGPLRFRFVAREQEGGLRYDFQHTALFFLPIPQFLGPQIDAYEYAKDGRYHFQVEVKMLFVGPVIAYGGVCDLQAL